MVVEPYLLQCVNNFNVDVSVNSDAYEPYLFGSNVYVIMYLSTYACVILLCCCPLVLKNCSSMTLLCTIIYLLKLSIFYKLYGNGPLQHVATCTCTSFFSKSLEKRLWKEQQILNGLNRKFCHQG